ncbi:hybrid signal transduction histidine kinase dhkG, partial [Acrasis kona]
MKLLNKDANERYKSWQGLQNDLSECQNRIDENNNIEWFAIGSTDYVERFNIPKHLYGREKQIGELISTFEKVSKTGVTEMMLVSGYSGIGKSSLVREVQRSAHMHYGYFASGKYDQMERSSMYSAIIESFQGLIKQILGEGENRLAMWKKRILEAVGGLGTLIIDLIPEVQQVIGEQPAVLKIAPAEAKNRLDLIFGKFVNVFVQ